MTKPSKFAQPFSQYEILDRLGSGGMGTVFLAARRSDGKRVALKVLRPSLSRSSRYVERLRREAEISMRLDHPGLVKGYGLGEEGGYHYLVMEYVEGKPLKTLLRAWGRFPEEQVLDLGIQVTRALAYAHEHGVIHRDIKPGNILVDDEGRAKLTDLGLAKGESDPTLTRDGATVGTPQYMSPEQVRDPGSVDERSDLYSLGATLYHMAVGLPPFEGESIVEVISKLLHDRADSAGSLNPEITTGLSLILRRLLVKDAALRYQSARQLLEDLERVQQGAAPVVDVKLLTRGEGRSGRRRLSVVRIGAGAILGAALAVAAWFVFVPHDERPAPITKLDHLARAVDAASDLRTRMELIDAFQPGPEDAIRHQEMRQRILRGLETALQELLAEFDGAAFRRFLDERGLEGWEEGWLVGEVQARLQRQLRYTPRSLPREVREAYAGWQERCRQSCSEEVDHRCRALIARLRRGYEASWEPQIAELRRAGDYAGAERVVTEILKNPWLCLPPSEGRPERLPESREDLLDELRAQWRKLQAEIEADAESAIRGWEKGIEVALAQARRDVETGFLARARGAIEQCRTALSATKPWKSLPESVAAGTGQVRAHVEQVAEELEDRNRVQELEELQLAEDVIHEVLASRLDLDHADRLLRGQVFLSPKVRERQATTASDLARLRGAIDWLLAALEPWGKRDRAWTLRDSVLHGRLLRVAPGSPPALVFREAGNDERTVSLADMDRRSLVDRARSLDGNEGHAVGLGLLLFYGDHFAEANVLLADEGLSRFAEKRKRREARIAQKQQDAEGQAARVLEDLRRRMRAGGIATQNLDIVAKELGDLRTVFGESRAVRDAEAELELMVAALAVERRRREELARLPPTLRDAVEMEVLPRDGVSVLRIRLPFGTPGAFPEGLGGWRRVRLGLRPPSATGEDAKAELAAPLALDLPVIEASREARVTMRLRVPEDGRGLDVLWIDVLGSGFLLAQPPGTSGGAIADVVGDPLASLPRLVRDPRPETEAWFFLPGASYALRIELGMAQSGFRLLRVSLNGREIVPPARVRARTRAGISVGAVGGLVLEDIVVEGEIRS